MVKTINFECNELVMKRNVLIIVTLLSLVLSTRAFTGTSEGFSDYLDCLGCHNGIEGAGKGHGFLCGRCHLPNFEGRKLARHEAIIRNPASPKWQLVVCGSCHRSEVENVRKSLHGTLAGVVNQTRYLWGAQDSVRPPIYSANDALEQLPDGTPDLHSPAGLVDDLLRRKCLRCHISNPGSGARGLYRATGCASCHSIYNDDGLYTGNDSAINKSKHGYPEKHGLTKKIPTTQCLHCHNSNHVGTDYAGLFQSDFNLTYQEEVAIGNEPLYGTATIRLSPDVHFKAGLQCIDCHKKSEVMGDGTVSASMADAVKASCTECHRGFSSSQFAVRTVSHRIKQHSHLRCSACHAAWSYQDYGLSVLLTFEAAYKKWQYLACQGDPYLLDLFKRELGKRFPNPPRSPDFISGKNKPGMWLMAWRLRRWEYMPLGINNRGKISVLRPQYQYLVSAVDGTGNVFLDSVVPRRGDSGTIGWAFNPYSPHTISASGRSCDSCHGNRVAAGYGFLVLPDSDTFLTVPSRPADPLSRLFTKQEKEKLLLPSREYKRIILKNISIDKNCLKRTKSTEKCF